MWCVSQCVSPPPPLTPCAPLPPLTGRLNVLANVVRKPMRQIFSEFSGKPAKVGPAKGSVLGGDEDTGSVPGGLLCLWGRTRAKGSAPGGGSACGGFGAREGGRVLVPGGVSTHPCCCPCFQAGEDEYTGSGDVKYHLGTSYNRPTTNGKMVALSLMANPR